MTICYPPGADWLCGMTQQQYDSLDPEVRQRAEALSWYTLASLTAYRIGVCPTVIRPCAARCAPPGSYMAAPATGGSYSALPIQTIGGIWTPYIRGGEWVNGCGCHAAAECGHTRLSEVILPGPIGDIEEVRVDGNVVDPTLYRVDNGDRLVSLGDPWPTTQDLSVGPDEVGSFMVTYYRGAAPSDLTKYAAGVLAIEFYRACKGDGKCRLPRGVREITRGGTTIELQPGMFENGLTGIQEVDAVINIYNPYRVKSPPRVLSPEGRRGRGRVQTWGHA